ncbi:MAG TPA: hypothetical protein VKP30_16135 [Polyangiaceae bacterium]|nr:hypothetical protein [Polyangiaceae bacterium]
MKTFGRITKSTCYLAAVLCFAMGLWPREGMAEGSVKDLDWAHTQFNKALRENNKHNYTEGRRLLREVWSTYKTYDVASELSRAEGELGHIAAGAQYTAYALAHAPPREGSHFKGIHEERLSYSLARIYFAKLKVAPTDLIVIVDGVQLDVPVEIGLYLEPGPHRVEFKKSGYVTETREIDAKAGVQDSLVVELKKEATASVDAISTTNVQPKPAPSVVQPLPPESPVEAPRSSGNATLAWTVLGVGSGLTAVAVGAGIYFHVKGADAKSDAEKYDRTLGTGWCPGPQSATCSKLSSALEDRDDHYLRAKILYGVGAGLAVATGVATWYFWPKSSGDRTPRVSAWAAPDSAGIVTYGRF